MTSPKRAKEVKAEDLLEPISLREDIVIKTEKAVPIKMIKINANLVLPLVRRLPTDLELLKKVISSLDPQETEIINHQQEEIKSREQILKNSNHAQKEIANPKRISRGQPETEILNHILQDLLAEKTLNHARIEMVITEILSPEQIETNLERINLKPKVKVALNLGKRKKVAIQLTSQKPIKRLAQEMTITKESAAM